MSKPLTGEISPALFPKICNLLLEGSDLLLRFGPEGAVREVVRRRPHPGEFSYIHFYTQFLRGKRLAPFYHLPPSKPFGELALPMESLDQVFDLNQLFVNDCSYASKNIFERYDETFEFHSTFPFSRLYLRRHEALGIFGVIRLNAVGAQSFYFREHPLLVLNREGKIEGFNRHFLLYFTSRHRHPEHFFGENAQKYLSPNPVEALSGNPGEFQALAREKWRREHSVEFSKVPAGGIDAWVDGGEVEKSGREWVWTSRPERRGLLQFKRPVDSLRFDFKWEIGVDILEGDFPNVIINGADSSSHFFPDYTGYLLGPDAFFPAFQIKKEGSLLHRVANPAALSKGKHALTVIQRGSAVALFVDGVFVLGIRDARPAAVAQSHLFLFCRERSRVALRSLRLFTLPADRALHQGFNEVTFRTEQNEAFYFQPLLDVIPPYGEKVYYAFVFHNVTTFKKNLAFLREAHDSVARERDKYRALAIGDGLGSTDFVGETPAILRLKKEAQRVASATVTVLVEGETGTGKEVLARHIHAQSAQSKGPFVKVDCSAIPESLLESELFGVEKGAFTGANETRKGKLEAADNGTLFLDELANLNAGVQTKLLQFLQDFTLERLGSVKKIKVKTRIVAATHRPLKELVEKGLFRADLYYRLSAVKFQIPPLRERREDISLLCTHLLKIYNGKFDRGIKGFSPGAFRELMAHDWPGNIRELENVVQKAILFCDGEVIDREHLSLSPPPPAFPPATEEPGAIPKGRSRALTRDHVAELLRRNNNIVTWAAKEAQVSVVTMFRKIKKFGLGAKE